MLPSKLESVELSRTERVPEPVFRLRLLTSEVPRKVSLFCKSGCAFHAQFGSPFLPPSPSPLPAWERARVRGHSSLPQNVAFTPKKTRRPGSGKPGFRS
jgi:hypothetical protein